MSDHIPTLADVCSAIAEGHIAVAVDGSMYQVSAFELRRYLNKLRSLPSLSVSTAPTTSAQDPLLSSDSGDWSASVRTSVA